MAAFGSLVDIHPQKTSSETRVGVRGRFEIKGQRVPGRSGMELIDGLLLDKWNLERISLSIGILAKMSVCDSSWDGSFDSI